MNDNQDIVVTIRKLTKKEIEIVDFVRYLKANNLAGIIDKGGNKTVLAKYTTNYKVKQ